MAVPADQAQVIKAIRLGWSLAEVRGRNRRMAEGPKIPEIGDRPIRLLPLRVERTETERRIEAQWVMWQLAETLHVNKNKDEIDVPPRIDAAAHEIYTGLHADPPDPALVAAKWTALAEQIYFFDAWIEDSLAAQSETLSAGYQLGRGLAESYWFDWGRFTQPPADDAGEVWEGLLGEARCDELGRLTGRLSAYFNQYTSPTVDASLKVWQAVADDLEWRNGTTETENERFTTTTELGLYMQIRRWYELIVIGQDPTTLVQPYTILRNFRMTIKAVRAFGLQAVLVLLSFGGVVALAYLSTNHKTSAWINAAIALVSGTGLTVAGAQAKLKNTAQALLDRISADTYTELIAADLVVVPPRPGVSPAKLQSEKITLIRKRTVTTAIG
jgi:hypothetical protein